ncbi:dienelactone hydrolase family protein [Amorphoplanes digitatis]|uniref:Dienelactone hydrolase n=1 Tax=Actinoplanes digitatis TaxID=1868 RepID=A0A7W7HYR8_9ACTN|nr:dienelactone hydrolase family protein [Actinoplanes digitatis]MBB4763269.1 dienelactone hydrolase [Actinoplanes digitatis]GID92088.1 dienelactone hydrolase [Actinoplanes digitatis]
MTDVVLFHHAQGLTAGVHAFADHLRGAGHTVTVPDLYAGVTFDSLAAGVAHARDIGMDEIIARGAAAVAGVPDHVVYAGFSLGAMPAQKLAQTRPGALGAIIYHGGVPASTFGGQWPARVPLQLHLAEEDEWSEVEVARDLAAAARDGTLFVYPGSAHLTTESSLAEYQPETSALILRRSLEFLHRVG